MNPVGTIVRQGGRAGVGEPPVTAPGAGVVASHWRRRDWARRRLLAMNDGAAVLCALVTASTLAHPGHFTGRLVLGALLVPAWIVLFKCYGLYDRDVRRISHSTLDDVPGLFHALVIGSLLMWLAFKVGPVVQLAYEEILLFGVLAAVFVLGGRVVARLGVRRHGAEHALLIGEPDGTRLLTRKLACHPEYGIRPVGVLACPPANGNGNGNGHANGNGNGNGNGHHGHGLPVLGDLTGLSAIASKHNVGRLIVWSKCMQADELVVLLRRCQELGLKVSVVPEMFDVMGPSVEIDEVEGLAVLGLNPPVLSPSSRVVKRAMDVVGAAVALILSLPLLLTIAVAIKLDSRGPVFFRQRRMGRRGRCFLLVKFRTMVPDAEAARDELLAHSDDPDWLKIENDPRITRVGRFLRHTSLDELPQFWNVLIGQMSLVGPRPLIESEDRLVEGWGRARLDLTPGITGLWQVLGRTNIPFKEMVKLDYLYVTNWSLWNDIRLVLRTLPAVLMRRGVN